MRVLGLMGDLKTLNEDAMQAELDRRASLRKRGFCDYCTRPPHTPACRFPRRHNDVRIAPPLREGDAP